MVLDAKKQFGEQPLATLSDLLGLRRSLGLTTEKMYFDWDNTEGAPYLFHFNWFEQDLKKRRDVPVIAPRAGTACRPGPGHHNRSGRSR